MKNSIIKKTLNGLIKGLAVSTLALSLTAVPSLASSHSEAPLISMDRYADNTDVYAFRSTEAGRENFVTIIANFIPFQDPSGGPQYYRFDDSVLYELKVDNTGDGREDITIQYRFQTSTVRNTTVLGMNTFNENGVIASVNDPDYNMPQTYSVNFFRSVNGVPQANVGLVNGQKIPPSNIGPRVTPNYENLAIGQILNVGAGKSFAGQRDEGFFIDVGGVFDLLNFRANPPVSRSGGIASTNQFNVNTIAIEIPMSELTRDGATPTSPTAANAVVGIWSTASRQSTQVISAGARTNSGPFVQVSRLGNPLVNEVVIPLALKDAFNSLAPVNDNIPQVVAALTDPELARLLQIVYGITIPPPGRQDIVQIFATGIPVNAVTGPNYTTVIQGTDGPHEYMRLNMAIPPTPMASRSDLGLLGGDVAGFPNGRRVGDDVVDIALRVVAGGTPFTPATNIAPNNQLADGVSQNDLPYLTRFPYLSTPHAGNTPRVSNFPAP